MGMCECFDWVRITVGIVLCMRNDAFYASICIVEILYFNVV